MDVKCLLWHSECAEYAFLKIVSLHIYFCRYVHRCLKSCFASFVTKGKSISSISLVYQNLHTFFDKNTTNRGEPQLLFSLNPKTVMFFFFNICIYSKNFLWFNMKISPHSQPLYSDTSAKKSMCFNDNGVLKTKLYQALFKKSWGASWYALHNMSLIINNFFFSCTYSPTHRWNLGILVGFFF